MTANQVQTGFKNEKQFFQALEDVFVGTRIEGKSGFVNLMEIKTRYYENIVFPKISKEMDEALKPFPEFREELFDRLYDFFKRYFSESGSICFHSTSPYEYVKIHTNRDVTLFWKTHMLYYVKTDRLFRSMMVEVDGFRFFFDVSALEHKRANEKRTLVYAFRERREDGALVFSVAYSERGRKTDLAGIRWAIKEALGLSRYTSQVPSEKTLQRAFRIFERQREVDYFINKDARRFLQEQFNLWFYQYVFEPEERQGTIWTERRLRQLQVLKEIAHRIIDFIARFEDELVQIWNKPKFVLESHYVITLDRIVEQEGGMEVLELLLAHPGMAAQVKEWCELGMVGEDFTPEGIWEEPSKRLHERYQYLPLDTKHFPDLEMAVLALFDHLDQKLDGWLIHSENYQALNTLLPKFQGRVKCIYIDPPYNSRSTETLYTNRYKHSTWLTLMENRLRIGVKFLTNDGVLVVAIDENEQERLGCLLEDLLSDFHKTCVSVVHNKKGIQGDYFSYNHDYAYFCISPELKGLNEKTIPEEEWEWVNLRAWGRESERNTARNCFYPIFVRDNRIVGFGEVCPDDFHPGRSHVRRFDGIVEIYPVDQSGVERKWRYARQSIEQIAPLLKVRTTRKGEIQILKAQNKVKYKTVWDDPRYIAGDYGTRLLTEMGICSEEDLFPKSLYTVSDSISAVASTNSLILDFFAGSGTTGHTVINLNREDGGRRKYILVEMANYFHTVLLPRIKKVVFSDKWRNGKAQPDGKGISHFVKYFRLEQYEEVLHRAHYRDNEAPLFFQDLYTQYVFLRDSKMLDNAETGERVMEVDLEQNEIRVNLSKLYPDIDLAETLSCLTGKWIRRIHPAQDDSTRPSRVEFEDGTAIDLQKTG